MKVERYTDKDQKDLKALRFLRARLVFLYRENENYDYIRAFDRIIARLEMEWILTP